MDKSTIKLSVLGYLMSLACTIFPPFMLLVWTGAGIKKLWRRARHGH